MAENKSRWAARRLPPVACRLEMQRHTARYRQVVARLPRVELTGEALETRNVVADFHPPAKAAHQQLRAASTVTGNVVLRLRLAIVVVVGAAAHAEAEERTNTQRGREVLLESSFRADVVREDVDIIGRRRPVLGGRVREPADCGEMAIECVRAKEAGAETVLQGVGVRARRDERRGERTELEAARHRLLSGSDA